MAEDQLIQTPCVYACADEKGENLNIEIDLPGVKKDNIEFKITEDSFAVRANNTDIKYVGSFAVCCPVMPDKAVAKYSNDKLIVTVPFKEVHETPVEVKVQ